MGSPAWTTLGSANIRRRKLGGFLRTPQDWPPRTRPVRSVNDLAECTKNLSNAGSLQNAAKLQNSSVAAVFPGNNVASAIQLGQDIGNLSLSKLPGDTTHLFGSNAATSAANAAASKLPTVVKVSATRVSVTVLVGNQAVTAGTLSVSASSLSLSSVMKTAVGQIAGALTLKTLTDFYVAGRAAAACYQDQHP